MGKKASNKQPGAAPAAAPKAKEQRSILLNEGPAHGQFAQIDKNPKSEFFTHNGNNYRITEGGHAQFCGRNEKPEPWMEGKD